MQTTDIAAAMRRHATILFLVGIMLTGAGFRLWHLGSIPFVADEFIDINASYGYARTGVWQAWDWNMQAPEATDVYPPRDERSWLYRLQVATLLDHLPPTETVGRLTSVLWGILTIPLAYWAAWVMTRRRDAALLAAFLVAVGPTIVTYDRKLRMYAMFYPAYLALATLLYLMLTTQPRAAWGTVMRRLSTLLGMHAPLAVPVALVGAVSMHLQLLTANIAFALVGYAVVTVACRRWSVQRPDDRAARWVLGGAVATVALAAVAAPGALRSVAAMSTLFMDHYGYVAKVLGEFQHPLLGAVLAVAGFRALYVTWRRPHAALWLAAMILVPLTLSIWVWSRSQGTQYVFYMQPFVLILAAAGTAWCATALAALLPADSRRHVIVAVFTLAALLLPAYGRFGADGDVYHRDNADVADYRKAFAYIGNKRDDGDALITRDFRNYYYAGWHTPVLDFGGERAPHDLSAAEVTAFVCAHPRGWVAIFDNDWDFVTKDARRAIESFPRVDHSAVRGAARVYRWDGELATPLCATR